LIVADKTWAQRLRLAQEQDLRRCFGTPVVACARIGTGGLIGQQAHWLYCADSQRLLDARNGSRLTQYCTRTGRLVSDAELPRAAGPSALLMPGVSPCVAVLGTHGCDKINLYAAADAATAVTAQVADSGSVLAASAGKDSDSKSLEGVGAGDSKAGEPSATAARTLALALTLPAPQAGSHELLATMPLRLSGCDVDLAGNVAARWGYHVALDGEPLLLLYRLRPEPALIDVLRVPLEVRLSLVQSGYLPAAGFLSSSSRVSASLIALAFSVAWQVTMSYGETLG
jgi:hypothetical protein